jgi:hypothetical protein
MQRQPNSKHYEDKMHNPKTHNGFFFAPSSQFEMVMDRRHFKDATVKNCPAENLNDDGDSFDIEHEAEEK